MIKVCDQLALCNGDSFRKHIVLSVKNLMRKKKIGLFHKEEEILLAFARADKSHSFPPDRLTC